MPSTTLTCGVGIKIMLLYLPLTTQHTDIYCSSLRWHICHD